MTKLDRQAVLDILSRLVTPGIKLTALADELGLRKHEYAELREILFDLVEEGTVHVLSGGAFALAPQGRANDPHNKPTPDVAEPKQQKSQKQKTQKPVQQKRSALPWKAAAPPKQLRKAQAREEYDPETG